MSKMPPNPYDIGPPDPEVLPCEICYGDVDNPDEWFGCRCPECERCGAQGDPQCYGPNGHMPTQAPVEPYGEVFYKAMQRAVAVESPIQPVPGVPFQLCDWKDLQDWERRSIHMAVIEAIEKFRQEECKELMDELASLKRRLLNNE